MKNRLMAMLLLAIFIIGMMPSALAAKPEAALEAAPRVAVSSEDVEIPNEDAIRAEPDPNKRIELCVAALKEVRPQMAEARARNLCKTKFMIKNAEKIEAKAKQLKVQATKIREKVQEFNGLKEKKEFKEFQKVRDFKARVVAQAQLHKAKVDFAKAKKDFLEAKEKFARAKLKLKAAKELRENCKDAESEECAAAKEELKEAAKEHFMNQADIIIRHLEQIRSRAESSESISEERASTIINWADGKIAAFEAIKAELEAASNKEEILDAAKKLRAEWEDTKLDARTYIGRLVNARIGGIIVKSKFLEAKLERTLEKMKENGRDTSEIEPLVDSFNAKIEEAKVAYEEALGHFDAAIGLKGDERAAEIREAQAAMKESKKALAEATKILRDIIKTIRAQGSEELEEASSEVEAEITSEIQDAPVAEEEEEPVAAPEEAYEAEEEDAAIAPEDETSG
ncbi:MAG: hypothetical protein ABIB71_05405 [Candidatus Woesearchaeota archaeon]